MLHVRRYCNFSFLHSLCYSFQTLFLNCVCGSLGLYELASEKMRGMPVVERSHRQQWAKLVNGQNQCSKNVNKCCNRLFDYWWHHIYNIFLIFVINLVNSNILPLTTEHFILSYFEWRTTENITYIWHTPISPNSHLVVYDVVDRWKNLIQVMINMCQNPHCSTLKPPGDFIVVLMLWWISVWWFTDKVYPTV